MYKHVPSTLQPSIKEPSTAVLDAVLDCQDLRLAVCCALSVDRTAASFQEVAHHVDRTSIQPVIEKR